MSRVDLVRVRGLSLIQPWCSAIVDGGKRVENRTWPAPESLVNPPGELWVALHAGMKWDAEEETIAFVRSLWPMAPMLREEYPFGRILGVARVTRCVRLANRPDVAAGPLSRKGFDAPHALEVADEDLGPWAFGPWCWVLEDVRALPRPIPCRGSQGLWPLSHALPPESVREVFEAVEELRSREVLGP